jgi:LacI family transcriptional regulator
MLSTVHQPITAMGRSAVSLLLDEMKRVGETRLEPPRQLLLRHRLVPRDSTAAPPA